MSQSQAYKIQSVIIPDDIDNVIKFMKRTFYKDEPTIAAVDLSADGADKELDEYIKESLADELSFKAVDGDGNIVGVTISGTSSLENKAEPLLAYAQNCPSPRFQKILYILAEREPGANLQERFPNEQKLVEIKFASTDPAWRQRGIMKELIRVTEKAVIEKGIKLVRIDTSSAYSIKTAESLGYTCVYKARYEDIKRNGVAIVVPAPPHVEDRVYVKQL